MRVVEECVLDGAYFEVQGEPSSGRFWATNRVLFLMDEISEACRSATHVVAAFAQKGSRSTSILVPLPCPPANDAAPALGCVGYGLTGPERRERAERVIAAARADLGSRSWPVGIGLEIYALLPDSYLGLSSASVNSCGLRAQTQWLRDAYEPEKSRFDNARRLRADRNKAEAPRYLPSDDISCHLHPPFIQCFPDLFDPVEAKGCWAIRDSSTPAGVPSQ